MNDWQRLLLDNIQTDFPIVERPFAWLGEKLHCPEEEILREIQLLKDQKIIRRIGPVFEAARLGYRSTLVAAQVPTDKLPDFVAAVNKLPGVSHNYGREHAFNLWFTLTMPDEAAIAQTLNDLHNQFDLPAIYSLPVVKKFKIQVNFPMGQGRVGQNSEPSQNFYRRDNEPDPDENVIASEKNAEQSSSFLSDPTKLRLLRALQEDLPLAAEPFHEIARQVGQSPDWVLNQTREWLKTGVIRRFGAALRHHQAGYTANAMLVFDLPEEKVAPAGEFLALLPQVSHCYERRRSPGWNYNLYAMTHARTPAELERTIRHAQTKFAPAPTLALATTAEYKKESVRYF